MRVDRHGRRNDPPEEGLSMRGLDYVGIRHVATVMLGGALAATALPGAAAAAANDAASLPNCAGPGDHLRDGEITSPWEPVLDGEGEVTSHRLTLRHDGVEHQLRTGRRGFAVRAGAARLLIGEREDGGTRLDMIDTRRACLLWSRELDRLVYPQQETTNGKLRLTIHDRDSRRYQGTRVLDPESGAPHATVDEPCVDACVASDGTLSVAALQPAGAPRPTPNFSAGAWPKDKLLSFRWKSKAEPPAWARSPLKAGAADARSSARARSPQFVFSTSGANAVAYTGSLPAFCGINAIACAGRNMPSYWGVWIRPHGTDLPWGTLRWCQKTGATSGCFDVRRVMLHELGHVAGLNHPSSAGFTLSTSDSIMQGITPSRPHAGASRHTFGRCDVATLQELYDTPNNQTGISTCNDVITQLSLVASRYTIRRGQPVKLTATLRVAANSAFRQLSANPLNGRSLQLKYRRAGSRDAWRTVWMRPLYQQGRYEATFVPGTSWEFKAVFPKPGNEGLRYSRSVVRKVRVTR